MRIKFQIILLVTCYLLLVTSPVYAQDTKCEPGSLSSDEIALCNLNNGLLPPEVAEVKPLEENLFKSLLDKITSFFGFTIKKFGIFSPRAEVQNGAEVPSINCQKDTSKDPDLLKQTADNLGNKDCPGVYNADLPDEVQINTENVKGIEELEAKSLFPEGINPF